MYTQDLNNAMMYETERRKDEMAEAREYCRVRQLLQDRPVKQHSALPVFLLNVFMLAMTLFRRH